MASSLSWAHLNTQSRHASSPWILASKVTILAVEGIWKSRENFCKNERLDWYRQELCSDVQFMIQNTLILIAKNLMHWQHEKFWRSSWAGACKVHMFKRDNQACFEYIICWSDEVTGVKNVLDVEVNSIQILKFNIPIQRITFKQNGIFRNLSSKLSHFSDWIP